MGVQERENRQSLMYFQPPRILKPTNGTVSVVHVRRLIYFVQVLCVYEGEDVNKLSDALLPSISTPHKLQST